MRKSFSVALFLVASLALAGVDVTGKWNGKLAFPKDVEKLSKKKDEIAAIKQFVALSAKMRVEMVLNKNNTFTVNIFDPAGKKSVSEGTWELKGSSLFTKTLKRDGKKLGAKETQKKEARVSKDGKQILRILDDSPVPASILFSR